MAKAANVIPIKSEEVVIESGVPIATPRGRGWFGRRSPLSKAISDLANSKIGDSFLWPYPELRQRERINAYVQRQYGPGWASMRAVDGGYRVWKLAEPAKAARKSS